MKTIILKETQLHKLIESNNTNQAPDFNDGDVHEYPSSEIQTSPTIHDTNGDVKFGKPIDSDEVQDMLTLQNFWANGRRGTRPM